MAHPYMRSKRSNRDDARLRNKNHRDGASPQALRDRLAPCGAPVCRIHFEDHGQDFLWFEVDAAGTVVSADMQEWVWKGCLVTNEPPWSVRPGEQLGLYSRNSGLVTTLRYPVTKVEMLS